MFALALLLLAWPARAAGSSYVHIRIAGVINPVKVRYVEEALALAKREQAGFVLVSIDTPGGLVSSMEEITSAFANADLPVVGFVEPTSAQATSAGAFILLSTDIAAMEPHTRVGAAHPVGSEGKDLGKVMNEKATNSLVSLARSLAQRRGRPESFADSIVRDAASYTAEEAKDLGAIEILADNRADLMKKLDGRSIEIHGRNVKVSARGAKAIELPMSMPERLIDHLADPTIASMLISLGTLGILYELASPGIGAAGIVGVVSLLTGLAAMSVLPLELGGVLLLIAGFVAIGVEIKIQSHGALAVGGAVSILLGALLLVDKARYFGAVQLIDWRVFAPFMILTTGAFVLLATLAMRARRGRFQTGVEALGGRHGSAKSGFEPDGDRYAGSVFVDGARWRAVADEAIDDGDSVEVVSVLTEPTRLEVKRSQKGTT